MAGSGTESWNMLRRRNSVCVWGEVRGNETRNAGSKQFVEGLACQAKELECMQ